MIINKKSKNIIFINIIMEVIDNTITDVDPLKLEIYANLELNSGVISVVI